MYLKHHYCGITRINFIFEMSVDVADKMANANVISILFKRRIAKPTNNILFTLSGTNQA